MTKPILTVAAALSALLSACAGPRPPSAEPPPAEAASAQTGWQAVISDADRQRLDDREGAWRDALRTASALNPDLLREEGALVDPDAGTPAVPPAGAYRCRTVKLGGEYLGAVAYPFFACRIFTDGDALWLVKETGSQRQAGRIYGDGTFLGGLALGDEAGRVGYGALAGRNVVGRIERLGPDRYRLVQPRPLYESDLDILELVPSS